MLSMTSSPILKNMVRQYESNQIITCRINKLDSLPPSLSLLHFFHNLMTDRTRVHINRLQDSVIQTRRVARSGESDRL